MRVHVDEMLATVQASDADPLVAPGTLRQIVAAVLAALREQDTMMQRMRRDTRITGGVAAEAEDDE